MGKSIISHRIGAEWAARHNALINHYEFGDNDLLARQRRHESNARSYPRRIPLALKRAKGIYIEDVHGRVFIDCLACAGTLVLGHNHPVVVEAIQRVLLEDLPMQTLDLTTPIKDQFVQDVFSLLPDELAQRGRIQFCGPTGTDAVEAALKLVKTATGRGGVLAFQGAYHGMSHGSLALMGNHGPKRSVAGMMPGVQFLPYPYDYRCPFGLGGELGEKTGIEYIRNLLHDPESGVLPPAGVILEAVQGEGGVVPASESWLSALRQLTAASQIPLILDEVQTGIGRTGRMFAFEHAGITPDVVVLSKAIGGGLPLSVLVYHESLDVWQPGAHAGTFRGNQLAMATGSAAIRFVRAERLELHAEAMGRRLRSHLLDIAKRFPSIGDVRGRGLMLGAEIVDLEGPADQLGHPPPHGKLASTIQAACLERGLVIELGGRHGSTIRFLPPLIITEAEIDHVAEIVDSAVRAVVQDED